MNGRNRVATLLYCNIFLFEQNCSPIVDRNDLQGLDIVIVSFHAGSFLGMMAVRWVLGTSEAGQMGCEVHTEVCDLLNKVVTHPFSLSQCRKKVGKLGKYSNRFSPWQNQTINPVVLDHTV